MRVEWNSPGDPRRRRERRHPLAGLLAVGIAAVIARSRSFAALVLQSAEFVDAS